MLLLMYSPFLLNAPFLFFFNVGYKDIEAENPLKNKDVPRMRKFLKHNLGWNIFIDTHTDVRI